MIVSNYPHAGHPVSGVFNQRSVAALSKACDVVGVLAPHPWAPFPLALLNPRWRAYSRILPFEVREGVRIYRPAYLQLPKVGAVFSFGRSSYVFTKRLLSRMHRRVGFDAILAFGLSEAGALAWRLGQLLGVPAVGWAVGSDVRADPGSSSGRAVRETLRRLRLVFYQSRELLEVAATLLGVDVRRMADDRHAVLPRGIPDPPGLPREEVRARVRRRMHVDEGQVLVLSVGRIERAKGVYNLVSAIGHAASSDSRITCAILGSNPAFDESTEVRAFLDHQPALRPHIRLLPACAPEQVWEYLCAADIFAFTSHHEGMPNSLLEAMIMEVPAVAFAIQSIREIDDENGVIVCVPAFDEMAFGRALVRLAASPSERREVAAKGRRRVVERFRIDVNAAEAVRRIADVIVRDKATIPRVDAAAET